MIQLYSLPTSGNVQKVRMALCFLDLAFEEVSLAGGGQKTTAFQEINPLGQVPVLVDGATTIRDSGAILPTSPPRTDLATGTVRTRRSADASRSGSCSLRARSRVGPRA